MVSLTPKKPSRLSDIPEKLLIALNGLGDVKDEVRIKNSTAILQVLKAHVPHDGAPQLPNGHTEDSDGEVKDNTSNTGLPKVLDYVLKRLVAGLGSFIESAHIGFSVTLVEVIQTYRQQIQPDMIIYLVNEKLAINKTDSKHVQNHSRLGKVLAYTSMAKADYITRLAPVQLKWVLKSLWDVLEEQPLLASVTVEAVALILKQVKGEEYKNKFKKIFKTVITHGWQKITPDKLHLAILLNQHEILTDSHISEYWGCTSLFDDTVVTDLIQVMKLSTCNHPIIHPVCEIILNNIRKKNISGFWRLLSDDLFSADKPSRSFLVYHLLPEALSRVKSSKLQSILTSKILTGVVKQLGNKTSPLHKAAHKLVYELVSFSKNSTDPQLQINMFKCLTNVQNTGYKLDSLTQTKTLTSIASHLSLPAARELSDELIETLSGQSTSFVSETTKESSTTDHTPLISWCCQILSHMIHTAGVTVQSDDGKSKSDQSRHSISEADQSEVQNWRENLLKFFTLHALYDVKKEMKQLDKNCILILKLTPPQSEEEDNSPKTRDNVILETCVKMLTSLNNVLSTTSHHTPTGTTQQRSDRLLYPDVLYGIITYIDDLLVKSESHTDTLTAINKLNSDELECWRDSLLLVNKIKSNKKENKADEAFLLLLLQLSFQLITAKQDERKEIIETLQEVHTCYSKASSTKRKSLRSSDPEPHWCDVLTELLISLMLRPSHLLRGTSVEVFTRILPHAENTTIKLLLDVFTAQQNDFDDDKMDADADDSEHSASDQEDIEENKVGHAGESASDDESSEEEESSGDESEAEVDEELRSRLAESLGVQEEDKSDIEDLSDSEMFKLDDMISTAFKNMRNKSKNSKEAVEKRTQIKHFKLRCLDLVEVVINHSKEGMFLLELLVPLLLLIAEGYKEKEMKEVGRRAEYLHKKLTNIRKAVGGRLYDVEEIENITSDILTLSTNINYQPIVKQLAASLSFTVRLLSAPADGDIKSPYINKVETLISDSCTQCLTRRDSKYNQTLFHLLFERQPVHFWSMSNTLLNILSNTETRVYSRTQACTLLELLLQKPVRVESMSDKWLEYTKNLTSIISKIVTENKQQIKPTLLKHFFNVLVKTKTLDSSQSWSSELSTLDEVNDGFDKDLTKLWNRLQTGGRKRKSSETQQQQQQPHPQPHGKIKKTRKQ